jgi:4-hydroxysphinganine ceramide fatty acyl 2-hydroxylase
MSVSKRIRIFTTEDVAEHNSSKNCWVTRNGKVYDVTSFLSDHPGGDDLIVKYAGQDIGDIMKDPSEHDHSDSAYDMLDEFLVGRVGTDAGLIDEDWVPDVDFHPDDTDAAKDFAQNEFLDLGKPLLPQIWFSNFSKSYYLLQVHQPRHLPQSARLFGPEYLEMFTRTVWYVVPAFWLPITAYIFIRSLVQFTIPAALPAFTQDPLAPLQLLGMVTTSAFTKTMLCFFTGNIIWTILEYTMHRFIFHVDYYLPDTGAFLTLHFLLHGVHHYLPMDRLRLVMPPPLFIFLSTPFTRLGHALFPAAIANGIIAGAFTFYILYDCMHYALHHTKLPQYLAEMKKYHLAHHYKNFDLGFGVTSKIWDYVFNTVLTL